MSCIQEMKSLYINDSYKGKCYKWNTDDLLMYLYVDERVIAIPLKYDVSLKETDNRIYIKVCRNQPIGQSARDDLLAPMMTGHGGETILDKRIFEALSELEKKGYELSEFYQGYIACILDESKRGEKDDQNIFRNLRCDCKCHIRG